jgi:hypothetical protein
LTQGAGDANLLTISAAGVVGGVASTAFNTEVAVGDRLLVTITGSGVQTYDVAAVASATVITVTSGLTAVTAGQATAFSLMKATPQTATVAVQSRLIDTMTLTAHGVNIYQEFPSGFYNAYLNYHYGGPNIKSPEDIGVLFVPFCLYPGTYQPSGHINFSRAREFYLRYTSSVIDSSTTGVLHVNASAINFLLISDGSAVLRYTT